MADKKSKDYIQSLDTGIKILNVLQKSKSPMKFSEIQKITSISKSNLYKYMNTLANNELVYRNPATGEYHLGNQLIQLGMSAMGNLDSLAIVTPYLQEIGRHNNNTVLYSVITRRGPVVTKIWHAEGILNIGAQIGTVLPPKSSSGKIFAAFFDETQKEYEDEELNKIHNQQIAFAAEPLIPTISSVSFPVFTFNKELEGIISVIGVKDNLPDSVESPDTHYLLEKQKEISKLLGLHL
ncbi:IclR family transcriptional regulator [Staphylococcus equorum]|uniref:IclR family transcriptional regulator n=1 Tax=Staphylococcus equorum TaxID=246432 RepID=UPI000623C1CD|nr:helix-turn-helix domain-containing protein [Staphylococcus equorum]KKI53488.1 Transcriptional regulator, IclR family [Staphylococcus equorum subsp. equorum]MCE5007716.1 helix-turn-helix domain-containing protein [Staphylococcus equorum]